MSLCTQRITAFLLSAIRAAYPKPSPSSNLHDTVHSVIQSLIIVFMITFVGPTLCANQNILIQNVKFAAKDLNSAIGRELIPPNNAELIRFGVSKTNELPS